MVKGEFSQYMHPPSVAELVLKMQSVSTPGDNRLYIPPPFGALFPEKVQLVVTLDGLELFKIAPPCNRALLSRNVQLEIVAVEPSVFCIAPPAYALLSLNVHAVIIGNES